MTPTNPIADLLLAAKALINSPEKLARGVLARDHTGEKTSFNSPAAVCWCSSGALYKAGQAQIPRLAPLDTVISSAREFLSFADPNRNFVLFSDTAPWPQVMLMWDRAIAAAQAAHG